MHALHRFLTKRSKEDPLSLTSVELDQLIHLCWMQFGLDFSGYARPSLHRRLVKLMQHRELNSFEELMEGLRLGKIYWKEFLDEITVKVTELFRDPASFRFIREQVLPYLASFPRIKIWVAGCSTGEELYSVAILLHEAGLLERTHIFGTDINPLVLQQARIGAIADSSWETYARNYWEAGGLESLDDYVHTQAQQMYFRPFLQNQMVILPHNLATDQSFNQFHLILCRNVCIYFDSNLQAKVSHLLDQSLLPLGFLLLGQQEPLSTYWKNRLRMVEAPTNCYQKYPLSWKK